MAKLRRVLLVSWILMAVVLVSDSLGSSRGPVSVRREGNRLTLDNGVLAVDFGLSSGRLTLLGIREITTGEAQTWPASTPFRLERREKETWVPEPIRPIGEVTIEQIAPRSDRLRLDERFPGYRVKQDFNIGDTENPLTWWAELREDARYLVCGIRWKPGTVPSGRQRVVFFDNPWPGTERCGLVDGSPIIAGRWFLGCEHPMSQNVVNGDHVLCCVPIWPSPTGSEIINTFAVGIAPPGQLRRGFLEYVERRRARPYQLFVNYNSWWDIADGGKRMIESECLDVINIFGEELTKKRGEKVDSFVFDDGWDDPKTLWGFHEGFPRGFAPLMERAAKYESAVGTWLSPFGGYGKAKEERMTLARKQGFEVSDYGFSLAEKRYYARFREICREMIDRYRVNYFKFDGIAGNNAVGAGDRFAADVEALLRLCQDLREMKPDVYLSITTGTWPSPYWLWFGDSVWRNGDDCGVAGRGSPRQRWITYRDMVVKRMIVDRAPLYPLNALMTIPVCFARRGLVARLGVDGQSAPDEGDLRDEMWMGFASGTQLAELYVTPQFLSPAAWDELARCIHWARGNGDVLVDTHWIGGDPGNGEIYGYAAWSPRKGIFAIRNPSDQPRTVELRLCDVWELGEKDTHSFQMTCRYAHRVDGREMIISPQNPYRETLPPWGILVWEGHPLNR